MPDVEILPFAEEHLPAAGRLLAGRHRRHRTAEPRLSPRFEDAATAQVEVDAAWRADEASGAVAVDAGEVVGYLLGAPKSRDSWGDNVWVESAGQGLADGADPEILRDLYGAAAARWVDQGRTAHYALTPSSDETLVRAWFQLGFGHQHTHALRDPMAGPPAVPPGLTIRPAARADIPTLARLDRELPLHQGLSPVFSAGHVPTLDESAGEWEEDFDDPDFTTFVAEREGSVIGSAVGCAVTKSSINRGLLSPDDAGFLGFAAVLPGARGHGAGRALGESVLSWADEVGFATVVTDFRQTNLLSSRAWPALGFTDTFWRLHRVVGL